MSMYYFSTYYPSILTEFIEKIKSEFGKSTENARIGRIKTMNSYFKYMVFTEKIEK